MNSHLTPEQQGTSPRTAQIGARAATGARLKAWAAGLKRELGVLRHVWRDPRTPWYARGVIFLTLAYALSPVDLIPDFVPVLGHLDDLVLVPLGIALALKLVPRQVITDARRRAEAAPGILTPPLPPVP